MSFQSGLIRSTAEVFPISSKLCFPFLFFQAYQTDNPQKYDTSMLFVEIADDNEFAPAFERKLYRAVLSEYPMIPDGVRVLTVKAVDKDFVSFYNNDICSRD